eukprot:2441621-Prymnesium_polylepis.2
MPPTACGEHTQRCGRRCGRRRRYVGGTGPITHGRRVGRAVFYQERKALGSRDRVRVRELCPCGAGCCMRDAGGM